MYPPAVSDGLYHGRVVRRAFAGVHLSTLDPFVHMDQMGEVDYAPGEPKGTPGIPTGGSRPSPT
jgi:quercetin 2,3-dioxygenase